MINVRKSVIVKPFGTGQQMLEQPITDNATVYCDTSDMFR